MTTETSPDGSRGDVPSPRAAALPRRARPRLSAGCRLSRSRHAARAGERRRASGERALSRRTPRPTRASRCSRSPSRARRRAISRSSLRWADAIVIASLRDSVIDARAPRPRPEAAQAGRRRRRRGSPVRPRDRAARRRVLQARDAAARVPLCARGCRCAVRTTGGTTRTAGPIRCAARSTWPPQARARSSRSRSASSTRGSSPSPRKTST